MKRYINIIVIASVCLSLFSCIKDEGNYEYKDAAKMYPATLTGISSNYEVLAGDVLVINPVFDGTVNESDYEYRWFCYLSGSAGGNIRVDTLGHAKNLDYITFLKAGEYNLYLKVRIKSTNISTFYRSTLRVITEFSKGWFLTKEQSDGTTDIDFFLYDEQRLLPNIMNMINESSIPGKPLKLTFSYEGYSIDGKSEPAFIVATKSDVWSIKAEDMTVHYKTASMFREPPDRINPYDLGTYWNGMSIFTIMINDGGFYWMESRMPMAGDSPYNDGRYSENMFPPADIDRCVCKGCSYFDDGVLLFFDNKTSSFCQITVGWLGFPAKLRKMDGSSSVAGIPNSNSMPYDLVYMKEYNETPGLGMHQGLGIMKSKTDGKYYGFKTGDITSTSMKNPLSAFVPVPDNANVATAAVRCVNKTNSTIYSSSGDNRVFAYKTGGHGDASGTEKQILTLNPSEKVTYMEDIRIQNDDYTGFKFKHLVVLTSQDDNWKMYCYDFIGSTDDINPEPVKTYTGKGKAVHVLYKGLIEDNLF